VICGTVVNGVANTTDEVPPNDASGSETCPAPEYLRIRSVSSIGNIYVKKIFVFENYSRFLKVIIY